MPEATAIRAPTATPLSALRGGLWAFLTSPALVDGDSRVRSWVGPGAFAYPEAAGIWLGWAAWRAGRGEPTANPAQATAVARRLGRDLRAGPGVGKAGNIYVFDTAIAWAGCLAAARAGLAPPPGADSRAAVLRALERGLQAPAPLVPGPTQPEHWSQRWGPYLRRATALLAREARRVEDLDLAALAAGLHRRAGEAVQRHPYVHAWCYALEAQAMEGQPVPRADLDRLAAWQRPDGGQPAWEHGGPAHADTTAQALRLWRAAAEPLRYAAPAARAAAFLAARQATSGGLRYADDIPHQPAWAACFADQAMVEAGIPAAEWV